MRFNVHAGHNADGHIGCGAGGVFTESTAARQVKDVVIRLLRENGHEVFDCTVDDAPSVNDNLYQIVAKCNANAVDLDISIHFNASDGNGHGTEVLVYSSASASNDAAQNIVNSIAGLGFTNRGVKVRDGLYVLRRTKSPALLIECCFCDNWDDANIYNPDSMGTAIVNGILGSNIQPNYTTPAEIQPIVENQPEQNIDWNFLAKFRSECIRKGQIEANAFVGHSKITVDGKLGPETKAMRIAVLQHAMNLDYCGDNAYVRNCFSERLAEDKDFGSKSDAALGNHYIEYGETQYMVTAMEIIAYMNGCFPNGVEKPGTYGDGMKACYDNHDRIDADTIRFCTLA